MDEYITSWENRLKKSSSKKNINNKSTIEIQSTNKDTKDIGWILFYVKYVKYYKLFKNEFVQEKIKKTHKDHSSLRL